jgi:hypothetical protein
MGRERQRLVKKHHRGEGWRSSSDYADGALSEIVEPLHEETLNVDEPFAFFSAMMVLQFALAWMFLPETKGISLGNSASLGNRIDPRRPAGMAITILIETLPQCSIG